MAKDPAFLFYTGDFLSGTMFFTNEQVGIYLRLLMAQHQHGRLSEKQVKIICNSFDSEVMEKFTKDEHGNYFNERLEIEISKRKSFSESRSNNRKGKTKQPNKDIKKKSKTYVNHMENENRNKDDSKIDNEIEKTLLEKKFDEFLEFRKQKKSPIVPASLQAFKDKLWKLSNKNEQTAIEILNESIANGWTGIFELKNNNNGKQESGINKNQHLRDKIRADFENKVNERFSTTPTE